MNNPNPNLLREMSQDVDLTGAAALGNSLGQPRRVKVFKSGNSLAVRMPKALGLEADMELELTVLPGGAIELRKPEPVKQKLDISGFWGKAPGLKLAPRRDFDERPSTIAAREVARKAAEGA